MSDGWNGDDDTATDIDVSDVGGTGEDGSDDVGGGAGDGSDAADGAESMDAGDVDCTSETKSELEEYIEKVIDSEITLIHKLPADVAESEFIAAMSEEGKEVAVTATGLHIS